MAAKALNNDDSTRAIPDLSLVIPVYRTAETLRQHLPGLLLFLDQQDFSFDIILVDDGSADGTAEILDSLAGDKVRVLALEQNRGKFGAIKAGMAVARGACRVFTDADCPYEPEVIAYMYRLVSEQKFHVIVGDRNLPGSHYRAELGWLRSMATFIFSHFVRLLVTSGLHDTQCGVKAIRGDVADLLFPLLHEDGFAGDVEMLYVALMHNLAIRRVPVRLQHQGPSTVRPFRDAWRMSKSLLAMRGRRSRGQYHDPALMAMASQPY